MLLYVEAVTNLLIKVAFFYQVPVSGLKAPVRIPTRCSTQRRVWEEIRVGPGLRD